VIIKQGCFIWQGVPYTIYWKNEFSKYAASHFHQAFFSVAQRY